MPGVPDQGDAWNLVVGQLSLIFESRIATHPGDASSPSAEVEIDAFAPRLDRLAVRVAELHLALARRTGDPSFDPEPMRPDDVKRWARSVRGDLQRTLEVLEPRQPALPEPQRRLAARVIAAGDAHFARMDRLANIGAAGSKTRIHGDLHLQQALICRDDFVLIDFEGEPQRSIDERRAKHSAWRDVAGMLRSFDYARAEALDIAAGTSATERERLAPLARRWEAQARQSFLAAYRATALAGGLYGAEEATVALGLLDLFEIEKVLYELRYELDHRPDKLGIPLAGIVALAAAPR